MGKVFHVIHDPEGNTRIWGGFPMFEMRETMAMGHFPDGMIFERRDNGKVVGRYRYDLATRRLVGMDGVPDMYVHVGRRGHLRVQDAA